MEGCKIFEDLVIHVLESGLYASKERASPFNSSHNVIVNRI